MGHAPERRRILRVGQEFEGTISGLTEWGMYVEIEPTKIEGMVMLKEVKEDYLMFNEEKYNIIGKASRGYSILEIK